MRLLVTLLLCAGCEAQLGPAAPVHWPPDFHHLRASYYAGFGANHNCATAFAFAGTLEIDAPASVRLEAHGQHRCSKNLSVNAVSRDLQNALTGADRTHVFPSRFEWVNGYAVPTVITIKHYEPPIDYSARFHLTSVEVD